MSGFKFFAPHPKIADVVDVIWDVDLAHPELARGVSFKVLPSAAPTLCVHYRAPTESDQRINPGNSRQRMTGVQTGTITIRPTGPVGALIIHLKPEAASALTGYGLNEFTDANIGLRDLFGPIAVSRLEDMLGEARDGSERARLIQRFLFARIRRDATDLMVRHAVQTLLHHPNCTVRDLASGLDIGERQLSRRFHTLIGTSIKRFARIVRLGKAVTARRRGANWAEITYACGYSDQAHLIRDFKLMTGHPPAALLRSTSAAQYGNLNAALAMSGFSNTFIV
ncbi:putative Transcriptional regulator, AraC family [Bradyrhizobium sp. STM 3843]|uniref:helix-turn-helix domain-containing protein n=1 Tax=Bradyrhizobium sp. STM 3843 TaxID=551947 RepID=UPI00024036EC|nr:AraC family transcriptional regulator [Bradyrhizobium sp. STM 3843]CCE09620.1 putative Transcriptional regulator, AraC family [Bradyrhizobium sp. STM 3843]